MDQTRKVLLMQNTRMKIEFVIKNFEMKNLFEYHNLYVQSDTLMLADIFSNFWKMCREIYKLDPAHFLSTPGLA